MKNKICMVTGANSGIGKAITHELAKQGATVVMVCRNKAKGEAALAEIQAASGNPNLEIMLADLSVQASIRQLAAQFKQKYDRLHVLINNAGGFYNKRELSADGLEMTFAVNHMAYFLLTHLLLDVIKASAPSRIINVSSDAHLNARLDFSDLQTEKGYRGFEAYGKSKLANVLFTYELARRLAGSGVTANCLHPGFVATNFATNNGRLWAWAVKNIIPFLGLKPEQGAETAVYLATSPEVEGVTGKYFDKKRDTRSNEISYDTATAQRLWEISEQLAGIAKETVAA